MRFDGSSVKISNITHFVTAKQYRSEVIFLAKCISNEIKKMFMSWETWVVITVCFALAFVSNLETLSWFPDTIIETAKTPNERTMFTMSSFGHIYILFLSFMLASIPCACSYYSERNNRSDVIIISKEGRTKYYIAKAIVTFITGFCVALLPLLIHYLFCIIALPQKEIMFARLVQGVYSDNYDRGVLDATLVPYFYMNYPAIDAILHFVIFALWVAVMTLFTYTISLFFRINIVVTGATSTLLNIAGMFIVPSHLLYSKYAGTLPDASLNFPEYIALWGALLLLNVIMLAVKIKWKRDII